MTTSVLSVKSCFGTTADDMNYKAKHGFCTEEDLRYWAETQNPNLCSIEWYVSTYKNERGFIVPQLYCRERA